MRLWAGKKQDTKPSKRPWWSPAELQFDPVSGSGSPANIPGQQASLDKIKKPAAQAGVGYLILKVLEIAAAIGTGGAAAPVLIF